LEKTTYQCEGGWKYFLGGLAFSGAVDYLKLDIESEACISSFDTVVFKIMENIDKITADWKALEAKECPD